MSNPSDPMHKLALKLLELFSRQVPGRFGFERYWPLAGPVETFSEQAVGPFEQELAKALQNGLQGILARTAPNSFHQDAPSVAAYLDVKPERKERRRKDRTGRR